MAAALLSWVAEAAPIKYSLYVGGGNTIGTIGGVGFTQGVMVLTFTGDTKDIIPFSVPANGSVSGVSGYELLNGRATVSIYDVANNASYEATFMPSAGIYVGVDNTNNGFGFGSAGVVPSTPALPRPFAYPQGFITGSNALKTYNLATPLSLGGWGIACTAFPLSCAPVGPPLATTAGDLILNQQAIASAHLEIAIQDVQFADLAVAVITRRSVNAGGADQRSLVHARKHHPARRQSYHRESGTILKKCAIQATAGDGTARTHAAASAYSVQGVDP